MNMKRLYAILPLVLALVIGGFFLWGLNPDRDPNSLPSVLISQPVPGFDLLQVAGLDTPAFSRLDLVGGDQVRIVNVFASWCVPCRAEHNVLSQMVENEGEILFGINYKDKPEDAVRWLAELGNPYRRIGSDIDGRAGIEWGISGVPETFIIGKDGTVLFRYVGPVVGDKAVGRFRAALAAAKAGNRGGEG